MKPYYEHAGITIYHGDCREILPGLPKCDAVITDPPYPDYYASEYGYAADAIALLGTIPVKQFVFWSAKAEFPLDYTAVHIWDKKTGCGSEYERIFERNGAKNWKVLRHYLVNSTVAASFGGDTFTGHPSQKPIRLMRELVERTSGSILDPFAGSGSTLAAAKDAGRCAIGIEREERYCEIAAKRLSQEVFSFEERSASGTH